MNRKGITLIELLVALTISGILVAGIYRTFIHQQHTYTVQDQVVDMQQNVRLAINRMTRELRMAGFGGGGVDGWAATEFFNHGAIYGVYTDIVNPAGGGTSVTVLEGYQTLIPTTLSTTANTSDNSISVNNVSSFDTATRKYISINGTEAHHIAAIDTAAKTITFPGWDKVKETHPTVINGVPVAVPIYLVQAITYSIGMFEGKSCLLRDDNLGAGPQPVAESIYLPDPSDLLFKYFDSSGIETADPALIRMIRATIVAMADKPDNDG